MYILFEEKEKAMVDRFLEAIDIPESTFGMSDKKLADLPGVQLDEDKLINYIETYASGKIGGKDVVKVLTGENEIPAIAKKKVHQIAVNTILEMKLPKGIFKK